MLYLTCAMIPSVDLAHYGVFRAEDWVSVDYGTTSNGMPLPMTDIIIISK